MRLLWGLNELIYLKCSSSVLYQVSTMSMLFFSTIIVMIILTTEWLRVPRAPFPQLLLFLSTSFLKWFQQLQDSNYHEEADNSQIHVSSLTSPMSSWTHIINFLLNITRCSIAISNGFFIFFPNLPWVVTTQQIATLVHCFNQNLGFFLVASPTTYFEICNWL